MWWQVSFDDYGIDWDGSHGEDEAVSIEVPSTPFLLHQQEVEQLEGIVDPLGDSQFYGIDIYMDVVC